MLSASPGCQNDREMRPSHLCLARQINSIHGTGKPNVGKNHRGLQPTQQHDCKRGFRALALDDLQIAILEQGDDECAQFIIIFYDQHQPPWSFRAPHDFLSMIK